MLRAGFEPASLARKAKESKNAIRRLFCIFNFWKMYRPMPFFTDFFNFYFFEKFFMNAGFITYAIIESCASCAPCA